MICRFVKLIRLVFFIYIHSWPTGKMLFLDAKIFGCFSEELFDKVVKKACIDGQRFRLTCEWLYLGHVVSFGGTLSSLELRRRFAVKE